MRVARVTCAVRRDGAVARSPRSSVEMITSVALITATAGAPFLSRSRLADEVLISETISIPPPMSIDDLAHHRAVADGADGAGELVSGADRHGR